MQEQNKIQEIDILFIQLALGLREIIKLENITHYSKEILQAYADTYKIDSVVTANITINDFSFILIWKDILSVRNFLHYDNHAQVEIRTIQTGKILWYPECCIKSYMKHIQKYSDGEELDRFYLEQGLSVYNGFPSIHMQCSKWCKYTQEMFTKIFSYYKIIHGS